MIALKWHSSKPDIPDIDELIKFDLEKTLPDGYNPSDLLFHTFFTEDTNGPVVHIWGEEGDDEYYHCEYDPAPQWVTYDMDGSDAREE